MKSYKLDEKERRENASLGLGENFEPESSKVAGKCANP